MKVSMTVTLVSVRVLYRLMHTTRSRCLVPIVESARVPFE